MSEQFESEYQKEDLNLSDKFKEVVDGILYNKGLRGLAIASFFPITYPLIRSLTPENRREIDSRDWPGPISTWAIGCFAYAVACGMGTAAYHAVYTEPQARSEFIQKLEAVNEGREPLPADNVLNGPMNYGPGRQDYFIVTESADERLDDKLIASDNQLKTPLCVIRNTWAYPVVSQNALIDRREDAHFHVVSALNCRPS